MPREYRGIMQYKEEILRLKSEGYTQREIGEKLGFSKEKVKDFLHRNKENEAKKEAVIVIKSKGRPQKDGAILPKSIQQSSKITQLQYELAMKERYVKQLEMENKLMRDFLSLTERK